VGTDYLSHLLWDKYLEFEHVRSEWSRVAQIYTQILQIPLQQLDRYLARLVYCDVLERFGLRMRFLSFSELLQNMV
jgi:hypothetical protein